MRATLSGPKVYRTLFQELGRVPSKREFDKVYYGDYNPLSNYYFQIKQRNTDTVITADDRVRALESCVSTLDEQISVLTKRIQQLEEIVYWNPNRNKEVG